MKLLKIFALTIFIILAFLATGCSTVVPVTVKFPDAAPSLMTPADNLKKLDTSKKVQLSDIIDNANDNATKYYELRIKYEAWQEWYKEQKSIFNELNK